MIRGMNVYADHLTFGKPALSVSSSSLQLDGNLVNMSRNRILEWLRQSEERNRPMPVSVNALIQLIERRCFISWHSMLVSVWLKLHTYKPFLSLVFLTLRSRPGSLTPRTVQRSRSHAFVKHVRSSFPTVRSQRSPWVRIKIMDELNVILLIAI